MFIVASLVGALLCSCAKDFPEGAISGGSGGSSSSIGEPTAGATAGATADADGEALCFDGLDDDGDGLPDCADPDCDDSARCVSVVDADWGSLGVLSIGAGGRPSCSGSFDWVVYQGVTSIQDTPAECPECGECTALVDDPGPCNPGPNIDFFSNLSCGIPTSTLTLQEGCNSVFDDGNYNLVDGTLATAGQCDIVVPPPRLPPEQYTEIAFCSIESMGAGCGPDEACVPQSAADEPECILRPGEWTCPEAYPARQLVYASASGESRGCSPCACDDFTLECSAEVTAHDEPGCSDRQPTVVDGNGACHQGPVESFYVNSITTTGTCSDPVGGTPDGCVAGVDPSTVCCTTEEIESVCPTGPGPAMVLVDLGGDHVCIDSTEVTVDQYQQFLDAAPSTDDQRDKCLSNLTFEPIPTNLDPEVPVTGVDWCDAAAYCDWAGKRLCGGRDGVELALGDAETEQSEWTMACRDGFTRMYPYDGAGTGHPRTQCHGGIIEDVHTLPCCTGPEPGLWGLVTNGLEWIDACRVNPGGNEHCAVMGDTECAQAEERRPDEASDTIGFRCCA